MGAMAAGTWAWVGPLPEIEVKYREPRSGSVGAVEEGGVGAANPAGRLKASDYGAGGRQDGGPPGCRGRVREDCDAVCLVVLDSADDRLDQVVRWEEQDKVRSGPLAPRARGHGP